MHRLVADYVQQAQRVKCLRFTGLKFDPFAHTNYLYGEGLQTNLTLTHVMLNFEVAVKMAERLAPLGVTWYEEPAGPERAQTLRAFRERLPSNVPICVGERHYTRHGFRPIFEQHVCDVVMPDITRCGGPSEMKRIATIAEAYGVLLAPHNSNGPLSALASAHVRASIPNFFRCEFLLNDVP